MCLIEEIDFEFMFPIDELLALFAILFGARRLKPSEHNPGLIASIAFESIVKLLAFIAVGLYVCFSIFDSSVICNTQNG